MKRALHIGLLLLVLVGLMGQSTAMAMAPGPMAMGAMNVSITSAACVEMTGVPSPNKDPCKRMTLRCMAAMGCVPSTLIDPNGFAEHLFAITAELTMASPVSRLRGRSYGPEPDPPSFLI